MFGALAWLAVGSVTQAPAYTVGPPSPALVCSSASQANLGVLENRLSPSDGATVQAGTPITFSGNSGSPLTIEVASSRALLATIPDIDSGLASALPEPYSVGPPLINAYTFTSAKATATPGTIYWDASFSTASITACQGLPASTEITTVRALTVLPLPAPIAAPAPPATPSPARLSLSAPSAFHLAHPTIEYRISCTASCTGDTYYHAVIVRRHGKPVRVSKLDLSPKPISIKPAAGGSEQIHYTYSGSALRRLKSLIHNRDIVEVQISAKVTDAAGNVAQAQRTARL